MARSELNPYSLAEGLRLLTPRGVVGKVGRRPNTAARSCTVPDKGRERRRQALPQGQPAFSFGVPFLEIDLSVARPSIAHENRRPRPLKRPESIM